MRPSGNLTQLSNCLPSALGQAVWSKASHGSRVLGVEVGPPTPLVGFQPKNLCLKRNLAGWLRRRHLSIDIEPRFRSSATFPGERPALSWRHWIVRVEPIGRITLPAEARRALDVDASLQAITRDRTLVLRRSGLGARLPIDQRGLPPWLRRAADPSGSVLVPVRLADSPPLSWHRAACSTISSTAPPQVQ